MKKILIINGPNLNMTGKREPAIYGLRNLEAYLDDLSSAFPSVLVERFQSNSEGAIIDCIQQTDADAIVINPGAYSHYSIAIADALRSRDIPAIEVHISNIYSREPYRRHSVVSEAVVGSIAGLGLEGYRLAVEYAVGCL